MANTAVKTKVIVILGPTAVGKTALAISLATHCDGEIISADSRQVYKGMDIGTGKVTFKEMSGVPHYLIDVEDPRRTFTVTDFVTLGRHAIDFIQSRGKVPYICGGTGFYIDSLLHTSRFPDVPAHPTLRKRLESKSAPELMNELMQLDPRRARTIDIHNARKIIRAIEIARAIGHVPEIRHAESPYEVLYIGLTMERDALRARIMERLLQRIDDGMVDEVRTLHRKGLSWKRMNELGLEYRYVSLYVRGILSKEDMISKLHTEICRYAKRQMTWFRRNTDIQWFSPEDTAHIQKVVDAFLKRR